jgi:predicted lipoprotein with Yx(FWY)xxD motif
LHDQFTSHSFVDQRLEVSMKRVAVFFAALALCAAGVAGVAGVAGASGSRAVAAKAAKVSLRHTELGKILVNSSGFTLYRFTRDPRNKDTCMGVENCSEIWPPLLTSGHPLAGAGVKSSLLSSIRLPNGRHQVTYAGHPLYMYAPATERGETSYVGFSSYGGTWYAVNAAGKIVK